MLKVVSEEWKGEAWLTLGVLELHHGFGWVDMPFAQPGTYVVNLYHALEEEDVAVEVADLGKPVAMAYLYVYEQ